MDNDTANALILKIWAIEDRLIALKGDLSAIETVLANQATEE